MKGWIGITLGDVTGIGPEVTLKALAATAAGDEAKYLLIGDAAHTRALIQRLGINLPLQTYGGPNDAGRVFIASPSSQSLAEDLMEGSPAAAHAAVTWLADGAQRCLRHEL